MSIDLGNSPVGTPPTDEQKTQLRSSMGLGSADVVEFGAIVPPAGTTAEIDAVTSAVVGQVMVDTDRKLQVRFTSASAYEALGSDLDSNSTVYVKATGTAAENGLALAAAYNKACALTPNGSALANNNRATLIIGSGRYTLASTLDIDTEFVDLISTNFSGDASKLNTYIDGAGISFSANNILVYGLQMASNTIVGDKPLQVFRSCFGGANSFGGNGGIASGTFIDCRATTNSFGGSGTASGTFINCEAPFENSFGGSGTASGTFTNCEGGTSSFGGWYTAQGLSSGTFTRCIGGDWSFGGFSPASGTYTNCVGGDDSFGKSGTLTGTLISCRTSTTFETVSGAGKTRLCLDGALTENNQG